MWVENTEVTGRIDLAGHPEAVLYRCGIANTSHVLDLAFDLAGPPKRLQAAQYGSAVPWHPAGSVFTGIGQTAAGVPIAYHGDWGAPGRWRLEANTRSRKLLFAPLEKLQIQTHDSFSPETVQLDAALDRRYKPGYYRQVERFIAGDYDHLLSVTDLAGRLRIYEEIFGYADAGSQSG